MTNRKRAAHLSTGRYRIGGRVLSAKRESIQLSTIPRLGKIHLTRHSILELELNCFLDLFHNGQKCKISGVPAAAIIISKGRPMRQ